MLLVSVITLLLFVSECFCWPDGAPCLRRSLQSMVPDSEEHKGGENPSPPPYEILVSRKCYHPYAPMLVTLHGIDGTKFKGFQLQARVVNSDEKRGEFMRDDNGSWKYQCFGQKNSITHSHPNEKFELVLQWQFTEFENGEDVQFIATMVDNVHNYWTRRVRSVVMPACRIAQTSDVDPQSVSYPPPSTAKFNLFTRHNNWVEGSEFDIAPFDEQGLHALFNFPSTPAPTTPTPSTTIGICKDNDPRCKGWKSSCHGTNEYINKNCKLTCNDCQGSIIVQQTTTKSARVITPVFRSVETGDCFDKDGGCPGWIQSCGFNDYVNENCKKTCGFCGSGSKRKISTKEPVKKTKAPTVDGACLDTDNGCPGWIRSCGMNDYVNANCKKSCNLCQSSNVRVTQAPTKRPVRTRRTKRTRRPTRRTTTTTTRAPPFQNVAVGCVDQDIKMCETWHKYCGNSVYMEKNCRKTCNLC